VAELKANLLLATSLEMARIVNQALARAGLGEAAVVGDTRRGTELVSELRLLVSGGDVALIAEALGKAPACRDVARVAPNALRFRIDGGGAAHLRAVSRTRFLEALLRETGNPRHVRWLESLARSRGGLAAVCAKARREQAVYEALGAPFAPPELREGPTRRVPELVDGVTGVFHVHTTWSDGSASIVDMARAARAEGFAYVGITEHSRAASYAGGLDPAKLRAQARAMTQARREAQGVRVLHGVEVDVLPDGSLDLDDATLGALDFVVASAHVDLDMTPREMTARMVRAASHPLVTILGHPTGRLLLGRASSAFDVEAVADAAAANGTFLEINANPHRLDLPPPLVRRAAARGAQFAIDPDAHTPEGLRDTSLGLAVARRAGLSAAQVLNARPADEVVRYLDRRRRLARRKLALA
jgi:DNA polymerase (family 10)